MRKLGDTDNIVLIGMPGVGKSTVGVLLAKAAGREFIDTDVAIQARRGRSLQELIRAEGIASFCRIEQQCMLELPRCRHVIATGGSAVYSPTAMAHLQATGPVVHLHLPLPLLVERLNNLDVRGVVIAPGQTLQDIFHERRALYERWADVTVDCRGKTQDQIVAEILARLELSRPTRPR